MKFTDFLQYLPKIQQQQLPAATAQLKMAPAGRREAMQPEAYLANNPRKSAVMMLVYAKNDTAHLVLTKRNTYPGIHSSQISFPGGKAEPEDTSLIATALRETYEEIGINPNEIEVVMPFSEIYIPLSNFLVMPFLGIATKNLSFVPDPKEVAAILELPLDVFLDDSIVINTEMSTSYGEKMMVPAFRFQDHVVWGATAMILSELKETIKIALK
jgi:8-oxo-dGTP pyrophosphatase MutT (NUDIX family)